MAAFDGEKDATISATAIPRVAGMPSHFIHSALTLLLLAPLAHADDLSGAGNNWPQWRGPLGTGVAPNADPPIEWSETKNVRWKVELPGRTLIVNWDHEGQSFVVALDKRTGDQLWKVERDEVTSWATPNRVRGYDLASGNVLWGCGGLSANIVASPVAGDGVVYVGSSYDKRALLAIRLAGAKGDITGTEQVLWSRSRGTPYVPSPLLYSDVLYFLSHYQGILNRVDARTGEDRPGPLRLPGVTEVYASLVGAADRVYVTDRFGSTLVVSHSDTPRLLARNQLDDTFNASAAIAGGELFLRGEKALYCLSNAAGNTEPK